MAARILFEVTAGMIPGTPLPNLTRRFEIDDAQWDHAAAMGVHASSYLISMTRDRAQTYAGVLMLSPETVQWVRTEYLVF